jgi:hypothetical protein
LVDSLGLDAVEDRVVDQFLVARREADAGQEGV